ncbi:MAG: hypothetical protein ACYC5H_03965 [Methylovirgula sp.]
MKPIVLALSMILAAYSVPHAQQRTEGAETAPVALADIMSATQFRHLKLGYAGKVANWTLAQYETSLMRQSFEEAARFYPKVGDVPFAELVKSKSKPALDDIGQAIAAKDPHGFATAFQRLTAACNNCHEASGVGFVVIRVPTLSPFSNQVFPPKP